MLPAYTHEHHRIAQLRARRKLLERVRDRRHDNGRIEHGARRGAGCSCPVPAPFQQRAVRDVHANVLTLRSHDFLCISDRLFARDQHQMLDDRDPARARARSSAAPTRTTRCQSAATTNSGPWLGRRAGAVVAKLLLGGQRSRPSPSQARSTAKRPNHIAMRESCTFQNGVLTETPGEGAAVVVGRGGIARTAARRSRAAPGFAYARPCRRRSSRAMAVAPSNTSKRRERGSTIASSSSSRSASIFLPRYSGVRPIIRPAMNTARIAKTSMPYSPEPTPAEDRPRRAACCTSGTKPADCAVNESCIVVDGAARPRPS